MEKTVCFDLTGKVAIVTGASRGLGVELATSLAEYGANLALMAGNEEKLKKTAAAIVEKTGVQVITVKVDIASEASVQNAVKTVMDGRPEEMSLIDWCECSDVDVTGTWLMSKEVVNAYMLAHGGRIVNICSVNSFSAAPTAVVYHVSKAAEAALTKSCAAAWAANGIYVNGIAPGNMQNGEMAPDTPPAILESIRNKVPQRRLGRYGDLSGALLFLASDANTYTQGSIIVCDGGLILEGF